MVFAGKDASAKKMVELRVCVAARDENAFACGAVFVPKDGHAMSSIFAVKANTLRYKPGPDMFQTNQTDAGYGEATLQLWSEARRQLALYHLRLNAEVGEDSSANCALNNG